MRLVFDCNVLISALAFRDSTSGKALLRATSTSATLLLSNHVLAELLEVIMRPTFDLYISKNLRKLFCEELVSLGTLVEITEQVNLCRDPKDNMYLELAFSGKADCLVTGDPDLLVLNPINNIFILTPKEFVDRF
jgi:putative PIN family toxin of toxin-antitoxin system